jgi:diadenosine tetraphosphatase ApaH/serine/threonine PP2A family protein phosphatase
MVACLYDVHGNLPALEAVLADAAGAERYVLGGDYALFGGWPLETVERLRELLSAVWIRGNCERLAHEPDGSAEDVEPELAAVRAALGDELVAELAALPETADEGDTLICHASPHDDSRSFAPEPADEDAELLEGVVARRVVFGHTHRPFRRMAGGIELVNAGSVGLPWDGDQRAAYAVLHDDGRIEHRRVEYDVEASAAQVASLGPWGENVAASLRSAQRLR